MENKQKLEEKVAELESEIQVQNYIFFLFLLIIFLISLPLAILGFLDFIFSGNPESDSIFHMLTALLLILFMLYFLIRIRRKRPGKASVDKPKVQAAAELSHANGKTEFGGKMEDMRICEKCGYQIFPHETKCSQCGTPAQTNN